MKNQNPKLVTLLLAEDDPDDRLLTRQALEKSRLDNDLRCVEDNGIGFDEKYLDRIFVLFQRLHGRTAYEGTGIGLAICRKIADRHGGSITAKSAPGEGSTFIITLPLNQPKELVA